MPPNSQCDDSKTCPYEVRVSPVFGRYLVASRDLEPREILIAEEPIIEGPTDEDVLLCLGCCSKLLENQLSRCSKCHFPLCGDKCKKELLHSSNECKVFQQNHVSFPPPHTKHVLNKSVMVLRCLLLKEKDPKTWNKLMTMSDNKESRKNKANCFILDERIIENLKKFLPSEKDGGGPGFDADEVLRLSGILDVNAHACPVKVNGNVVASKCHVYHRTSLIAHSCNPNSSWSGSGSKLVIRTNVRIPSGEIISVAYDDSDLLYGTYRRLTKMEVNGMFTCKCTRCLDPTELGTYFSALKCLECSDGYLLSLSPTDSFSDWKCQSCHRIFDEEYISEVIEEAERAVGFPKCDLLTDPDSSDDVELLKEYIDEFGGRVLHPNHYVIQEVNLRIVRAQCYSLQQLTDDELRDYLERCGKLLEIANVLVPGFGEYRAFLQYQYFRGLLALQERVSAPSSKSKSKDGQNKKRRELIDRYKLILQLQEEVLNFLGEKFTASSRIAYVQETMGFAKDQIRLLEGSSGKEE